MCQQFDKPKDSFSEGGFFDWFFDQLRSTYFEGFGCDHINAIFDPEFTFEDTKFYKEVKLSQKQ